MLTNSVFISILKVYIGGSNIEHSNSESITNPYVLEFRFRTVPFWNGRNHTTAIALVPTIQNGRFRLGFLHNYNFSLCYKRSSLAKFSFRMVRNNQKPNKMAAILFKTVPIQNSFEPFEF